MFSPTSNGAKRRRRGEQGAGWAFSPTAIILKLMLERQLRMPPLGTRSELSMGGGDRRGKQN